MVIIVENTAKKKLRNIYAYYNQVAGKRVATKMRQHIQDTIDRLIHFPHLGQVVSDNHENPYTYRSILAHPHYKVIYRIAGEIVYIADIWDSRQEPGSLTL